MYTTKEEAQEAADIENMGRDYSTVVVIEKNGLFFLEVR